MKRIHFEKVASTHLYAKENIDTLKAHGQVVITADYQTRGIGRRLDKWHAPKNSSLLTSFVYKAPHNSLIPFTSNLCAQAIMKTLAPLDLNPKFKHPNDLLVRGKKLSGVISEICGDTMITSAGINICQSETDLSHIDQPATSLFIETKKIYSSETILQSLLAIYFEDLKQLEAKYLTNKR